MKVIRHPTANDFGKNENRPFRNDAKKRPKPLKGAISRRSFLGTSLALGAGTIGAGFLPSIQTARASGGLTPGEAALLRVPSAPEATQADFLVQINQIGGNQGDRVPGGK